VTKRWSSTRSGGQTKREASKDARKQHRVGEYLADYEPLTPDEMSQSDAEMDELMARSRHVDRR
jgi:hypothetical protein